VNYFLWALILGAISAVSLPLGSWIGLNVRFSTRTIAIFASFGAGALIAALSVELVAPTAFALTQTGSEASEGHAKANFFALLVGSVAGGLLFVALDRVVNQQGGYLRKASTTLEHFARRRRESVKQVIDAVMAVPPFDKLDRDLAPTVAAMLRPQDFKKNQLILEPGHEPTAYVLLEGEASVEISGQPEKTFGPGTLLGALLILVPGTANLATIRATTAAKCLALRPGDMNELKARCPEFDEACRRLAAERMDELEQFLTTKLSAAVDWAHSASAALKLGHEVPELALRRAEAKHEGSPLAVWLGILLDGIPESIVIGAGLFTAVAAHSADDSLRFVYVIPYTLIAGLFLSNLPEALSSSANMLSIGWTRRRIFIMWFALMVTTAIGSGLGFLLAGALTETWLVFAEGLAAGAMLTMIAAAMIPEAAAHGTPNSVGLSTLAGFLTAVFFKLFE
jgi:zinc transporter ZupT